MNKNMIEYFKNVFDQIGHCQLLCIGFPLPPSPTHSIMYMPDSYHSKTEDIEHYPQDSDYKILRIRLTEKGPAVLCSIRLDRFFTFQNDGTLDIRSGAFCITVNFKYFLEVGKLMYVSDVVIDDMALTFSCNPQSHMVVPFAPYITSILQYCQSPKDGPHSRDVFKEYHLEVRQEIQNKLMYTDYTKTYPFEEMDFNRNINIDNLMRTFVLDEEIRPNTCLFGLGKWGHVFLSELRTNRFLAEEADNGKEYQSFRGQGRQTPVLFGTPEEVLASQQSKGSSEAQRNPGQIVICQS